jgi:hypothetical protein
MYFILLHPELLNEILKVVSLFSLLKHYSLTIIVKVAYSFAYLCSWFWIWRSAWSLTTLVYFLIDFKLSERSLKSKQFTSVQWFSRAFWFIHFDILLFQEPVSVAVQFLLPRVCLRAWNTDIILTSYITTNYSVSILFGSEEAGTWIPATGLSPAGRQDRVQTKY